LLDAQEIEVSGGMDKVIRVLMHVETDLQRSQIRHVYLGKTAGLRPDIAVQ
jgi:chorismate mutase